MRLAQNSHCKAIERIPRSTGRKGKGIPLKNPANHTTPARRRCLPASLISSLVIANAIFGTESSRSLILNISPNWQSHNLDHSFSDGKRSCTGDENGNIGNQLGGTVNNHQVVIKVHMEKKTK
ncbi:hypothetical protein M9H77_03846 [Catharanthus roseus]|uniref:Uncharacterized protein n=1 Tax=Catharanthus roseus TaxID=4058 RepID=A0ACC0CCX6_CATRO|nr:hypothetical protein M9H77_03846 [Catharanthus roseus]